MEAAVAVAAVAVAMTLMRTAAVGAEAVEGKAASEPYSVPSTLWPVSAGGVAARLAWAVETSMEGGKEVGRSCIFFFAFYGKIKRFAYF